MKGVGALSLLMYKTDLWADKQKQNKNMGAIAPRAPVEQRLRHIISHLS